MSKDPQNTLACTSNGSWGIGGYIYLNESGIEVHGYGYYKPENPHHFFPDLDCCTEKEINTWKKACQEWDKNNII